MTRSLIGALLALSLVLVVAPVAGADPEPDLVLTPGYSETTTGSDTAGTNLDYHGNLLGVYGDGECNGIDDPQYTCESFLIRTDAMLDFTDEDPTNDSYQTSLSVTLSSPTGAADYDLKLWKAKSNGQRLSEACGTAGGTNGCDMSGNGNAPIPVNALITRLDPGERLAMPMTINTAAKNVQYFVLDVVFYAAAGGYELDISF